MATDNSVRIQSTTNYSNCNNHDYDSTGGNDDKLYDRNESKLNGENHGGNTNDLKYTNGNIKNE